MADTITTSTVAQSMAEVNMGAEASQTIRGQFRGETVAVATISMQSLVESAKEEMSFAVADAMGKGLNKRKFSEETRIQTHLLEKADAYLKKVPDLDKKNNLEKFAQDIKSQPRMTPDQMRQAARDFSKDPTLQYAALAYVAGMVSKGRQNKALMNEDERALTDTIGEVLHSMMEENGPEIKAGLNTSQLASQSSSETLGDTQQLRSFYRDSVLDYGNITVTYKKIIRQYGSKGFAESLDFLLKGLGADLASQGASIAPSRLRAIMDDMYVVKTLGVIHEIAIELMQRMHKYHGNAAPVPVQIARAAGGDTQTSDEEGLTLMSDVLDIKELSLPKAKVFMQLAAKLQIQQTASVIYFLQETKRIIRLIPEKVYDNDSSKKLKLLNVVQEALDMAIVKEDEEL